ncbi:cysteine dioxygenase [Aquihabitans sp. McL0605]|uniref:cysteine dioxygenase n=1 Tax=Aquihabitans sp. McL0605 TaxID=3415671 RepID=UPI003CFB3521
MSTPAASPLSRPARLPIDDRSPAARRVSLARPGPRPTDPPVLPVGVLADIALGLARATELWQPHVSHDPLSRTSVRLVATESYEVWLLGWTQGQRVEFHDHGGSNAAFAVLEGELQEITLGVAGTTSKRLTSGRVGTVAAGTVHDVINPTAVVATSLHVYSNPLRTMTYYDGQGRPTYTELVEQVPALVTSPTQARALHPSRARA